MISQDISGDIGYSLLTIIVSRGKGSKVLQFAVENGARDASCFLGKGTINNSMLQLIEMNEVKKEIIIIVVPSVKEEEILNLLNKKFHFDRQNHGIAFVTPLAGILKMKSESSTKWRNNNYKINHSEYAALLIIVDKGHAETVIQISQNAGYYGGTIIKARGTAGILNIALNMIVEPEKEAVLMVTEANRVQHLATHLNDKLSLNNENTGILMMTEISKIIGLFQKDIHKHSL